MENPLYQRNNQPKLEPRSMEEGWQGFLYFRAISNSLAQVPKKGTIVERGPYWRGLLGYVRDKKKK